MSFKEHFFDCKSSENTAAGTSSETQNSDKVTPYLCEICGQNFRNKTSVLSHIRWRHEIPYSNQCSVCQKIIPKRCNLDRHQKNCTNKCQYIRKKKTCCFCDFTALSRAEVFTHYEVNHNVNITRKTLNFNTFEEFKIWKQKYEKDTKSCFIKTTHTRRTKGGVNISSYICHRDGYFKSRSKGIRRIKMVGSNKINSHCPASITASETDQSVKVVYIDTHVGHELDISHLNISEPERADIAQKLANKIPFDQILDDIHNSVVNGERDRIHLATRKDLWNIVNSYNLNHETIVNKNDLSTEDWVLYMQKTSNLVRFYKQQEVILEDLPELEKEDFFLVIMNDAQKEILQKFGNDCVCIDSIHGLNAYDFQLYTIMVLDDKRQAFPCSFLFSNRGDSVAMEIFFTIIKDCLHDTSIKPMTFMSDMDDTFFYAWSAVIGPVQNKLFCSWHVDKAWRKNLGKIKNKEKQAVVYQKIKIIMYESDPDAFSVMLNNLLEELRSDTDCLKFSEYFETYVKKCTSWAYCYRKEGGIDADMNLENMHRILKHICFGGRKVKRVDKVITMFMKFIRNKLFDRPVVLNKAEISKKLASIRHIHKKSLELKNTIIIDQDNYWNVSASNCDDMYRVETSNPTCSCDLRCQDCDSCIHGYTCSCIDFSIKWNMCKHIHLVCMFLKSNTPDIENIGNDTEVICYEEDDLINDNISEAADNEESAILYVVNEAEQHSFDERKLDLMEKFLQVYNAIESEEQLEAVWKRIAPLEDIVKALSKKDIPIPKVSNELPNKEIRTETTFSSTKSEKLS